MKCIIALIILLLTFSCQLQEDTDYLTNFIGTKILTTDSLMSVIIKNKEQEICKTPMMTIINYNDSLSCSSCVVTRIDEWSSFVDSISKKEEKILFKFIFSPKKNDINEFLNNIRLFNKKFTIYIGEDYSFTKVNPHLPSDRRLQTFLLDKNNKVILVGNPIHNDRLMKLYKKTILKLSDNGGELPEEVSEESILVEESIDLGNNKLDYGDVVVLLNLQSTCQCSLSL